MGQFPCKSKRDKNAESKALSPTIIRKEEGLLKSLNNEISHNISFNNYRASSLQRMKLAANDFLEKHS